MKRALVLSLICVLGLSLTASAGWKFGAEQGVDVGGLNFPLEAYFGFDFNAPFIDMTALSIAGDIVVSRAYNWAAGLTGVLALDSELVFSYKKSADIVLSMSGEIDYTPLPETIDLNAWNGGLEIVGYVNSVLTLNTGVKLTYFRWPAPSGFDTTFFFGFDAAW